MSTTYCCQQIQVAVAAMKAYKEKPFVSHEWEELVFRLSRDSDPQLREKMYREIDEIVAKDPGFNIFRMH
jgi:hypothetical protein